jgi:Probable cobalt transporter subunit (CbtB)
MRFAGKSTARVTGWHHQSELALDMGKRFVRECSSFQIGRKFMERTVAGLGVALPEPVLFLLKSGVFLCASAVILYVALSASYPAVHDTLHNFRHALAVVPCH